MGYVIAKAICVPAKAKEPRLRLCVPSIRRQHRGRGTFHKVDVRNLREGTPVDLVVSKDWPEGVVIMVDRTVIEVFARGGRVRAS